MISLLELVSFFPFLFMLLILWGDALYQVNGCAFIWMSTGFGLPVQAGLSVLHVSYNKWNSVFFHVPYRVEVANSYVNVVVVY